MSFLVRNSCITPDTLTVYVRFFVACDSYGKPRPFLVESLPILTIYIYIVSYHRHITSAVAKGRYIFCFETYVNITTFRFGFFRNETIKRFYRSRRANSRSGRFLFVYQVDLIDFVTLVSKMTPEFFPTPTNFERI